MSAVPPWPMVDGYSVRAGHFLEELARERSVTIVSPFPEQSPEAESAPDGIEWVKVKGIPATNVLPWREERGRLTERVAAVLDEGKYRSALLWNGVEFIAGEISGLPPTVADRIDCEALQAWRGRRHSDQLRQKLRHIRRGLELAVYESTVLRRLDGLVVTAPDDARALRLLTGRQRVEVIPNGVALPRLGDHPGEAEIPTVVFTGVLSYGPNVEAARYFTREVWPEVRHRLGDARFVVAGRSPASSVLELANEPGVTVRADVPDLTAEIRTAWVAVAPMRSGSGIKNKVLEAWAAERPVVMTELATNGLEMDVDDEMYDLVCDGSSGLARTVADLLEDQSRRRHLGREAREIAEARHSWEAASRRLGAVLDEAVDAAGQSTERQTVAGKR